MPVERFLSMLWFDSSKKLNDLPIEWGSQVFFFYSIRFKSLTFKNGVFVSH